MSPMLANVGEVPEAIIPLDQLGSFMSRVPEGGARGGGGMTVIVEGNIMDGEDFWDRVAEGLREVRRGGGGDDPFD